MTNNEAISSVLGGVNKSTDDFPVRRRFVYRELKATRNEFVKQELNKFRLMDDASGQTIDCFEMESVDASTCYGCESGTRILKSKHPLPDVIESNLGLAIINIYFPNGVNINSMSFADWDNRQGRRNKMPGSYGYAIRNRHLHLLGYDDVDGIVLIVTAHFVDPEEVDRFNSNSEGCPESERCKGIGDYKFHCPGHIERRVFETTRAVIFRKLGIPLDQDNNSKFDIDLSRRNARNRNQSSNQ